MKENSRKMKWFFLLAFFMLPSNVIADSSCDYLLPAKISDASGVTNIRDNPKGNVVTQINGEGVFQLSQSKNGWWRIANDEYVINGEIKKMDCPESGCWVHNSVIILSLSFEGDMGSGTFFSKPDINSDNDVEEYGEENLRPVDKKEAAGVCWVKCKYTWTNKFGWIQIEKIQEYLSYPQVIQNDDGEVNGSESDNKSADTAGSDAMTYVVALLFIISLAFYIYIFRRSRQDNGLVIFVGGKTGLFTTLAAWIALFIDFFVITTMQEGGQDITKPIVFIVITGIIIIASVIGAVVKSVGWKNKVFSVYGHLYTVLLSICILILIIGLYVLGVFLSKKTDHNGNTLRDRYGNIKYSEDIYSTSARALLRVILRFVNGVEI